MHAHPSSNAAALRRVTLALMILCISFACAMAASAQGWLGYGSDPRHTAISPVFAQALQAIHWSTPVDLNPQYNGSSLLVHYGSPLVTPANTVIVPVKTGMSDFFRVEAHRGDTGALVWQQTTDYTLPPHNWTPSFGPTLTPDGRLVYPGAGGTVYVRTNPDSASGTTTQLAFYGPLGAYTQNASLYNANVMICTPIVSDNAGNIYFGFIANSANVPSLSTGIARIGANGVGSWVSAASTAPLDGSISRVAYNCAPALSNDGGTVYIAVSNFSGSGFDTGYLVALNSTTLAPLFRARLKDVSSSQNDAFIPEDGTASPVVGPDGDVYYGVLETGLGSNHFRGWMLHFDSKLAPKGANGAFGWDDTASVVPAGAVPSYQGNSSYLILTKYNDYVEGGGDGVNKMAILDPNASMVDPISGATVMQEVLTVAGPTPDTGNLANHPNAVREWCINTAVVDAANKCAFVNNEDGKLYRWDFSSNSLADVVTLTGGIGEAYTPTLIGPDGTVYAINDATLFAVGVNNLPFTYRINCAGRAVDSFAPDAFFSGGQLFSTSATIDTSGATNPAPMAVYQTVRWDASQFSYSFPNLTPGESYLVRLHFVEPVNQTAGQRPTNVSINGSQVLTNFDPFTAAGGYNRAVVREFTVAADSAGKMNITFVRGSGDTACVAGIEVAPTTPTAPSTPTGFTATAGNTQVALSWSSVSNAASYNLYRSTSAGGEGATPYKTGITTSSCTDTGLTNGTTYFYQVTAVNTVGESPRSVEASAVPTSATSYRVNCSGSAVGSFAADAFFSGGQLFSTSAAIDTSGATNPAPMAVYQTVRWDASQLSYSFPNLTAGGAYLVRLHFVEPVNQTAGQRPMNVSINGSQLLTGFDPFTAAGGFNKAVVREFIVTPDAEGVISITFVRGAGDTACVAGIEVLPIAPTIPSTPTGFTATAGNTQITLNWSSVNNATSYNLYRSTSAGGEGATPYKTGITAASYTDIGLTNGTTYFYQVTAVNTVGESPRSVEASATPTSANSTSYKINCSGGAVGNFAADAFFSGGQLFSTGATIETSGASNPAPMAVYQTVRWDASRFSYSFPNLTAGGAYLVRLHFVEPVNQTAGRRPTNVSINGSQVLAGFDPFTAAGGYNRAVVKDFTVTADSAGNISITFVRGAGDTACVAGIEVSSVTPTAPSTPTGFTATAGNAQVTLNWSSVSNAASYNLYRSLTSGGEGATPYKTGITTSSYTDTGLTNGTTYFYQVTAVNTVGESPRSVEASATPAVNALAYHTNCSGGAVANFAADAFFSGGQLFSTTATIDTNGVTNPAPMAVYQTVRWDASQFSYSFPNLTLGESYLVRLHFVEPVNQAAGQRPTHVSINGSQVLTNFDPFTAVGGANKAVVKEFNVTPDSSGNISITFVRGGGDTACVAGIEVTAH